HVPGLVCRRNGRIHLAERGESADIDTIPIPARDTLLPRDFMVYRKRAVSMITSRGCPNDCSFCTVRSLWGRGYRERSVDMVLGEIDECITRYGASLINFEDDNLFPSRDRAAALLDGLTAFRKKHESPLDLTATNGVSIEGLDPDIVSSMHRAGFREINISLMSRSGNLQMRYRRPFDSAAFARIARTARALGMNVRSYFILGLPGQTTGEVRDTIAFLRGLKIAFFPSVYYNVRAPKEEWPMQRSSAFYNETGEMNREDLLRLFNECR
ncbi:MAG: radical SAM protein, partial [Chrysiogenales bacterium]